MLARILSGSPPPSPKPKSGVRGVTPVSAGSYRQAVCPTCGHLCEVDAPESAPAPKSVPVDSVVEARPGPRRVRSPQR